MRMTLETLPMPDVVLPALGHEYGRQELATGCMLSVEPLQPVGSFYLSGEQLPQIPVLRKVRAAVLLDGEALHDGINLISVPIHRVKDRPQYARGIFRGGAQGELLNAFLG